MNTGNVNKVLGDYKPKTEAEETVEDVEQSTVAEPLEVGSRLWRDCPNEEEIAARAAAIRASWSPTEERIRAGRLDQPYTVEPVKIPLNRGKRVGNYD